MIILFYIFAIKSEFAMKAKGLLLRDVPTDVREYILDEQTRLKKKKGTMVSLESTVYKLIRELKSINELQHH